MFRVSPNELSFASVDSWKAIYGHQPAGRPIPVKSRFYEMYGSGYNSLCIGSERDPKRHSVMKRNLVSAFSTRALLEQESIISLCIDRFIEKVGAAMDGARHEGLNMTKWYEMLSFDILGEMAFGESFHAVENGMTEFHESFTFPRRLRGPLGKPHFWSELIVSHLFFITVLDNLSRYPFFVTLGSIVLPWATTSVRDKHSGYSRAQVQKSVPSKHQRMTYEGQLRRL